MKPPSVPARSGSDRRVRIQLLRLQAQYDRLAWSRSACRVAGAIQPTALAAQARDRLGAAGLGWLGTGLGLMRRYPVMLSLLSSVVTHPGRRRLALKTALIAGLVWLGRRKPPAAGR